MCNESSKKENCEARDDSVLDYSEFKKTVGETTTNFSSRFMPNVKFNAFKYNELLLNSSDVDCNDSFPYIRINCICSSDNYTAICNPFCYINKSGNLQFFKNKYFYNLSWLKEVSIYQAIPELVPYGMVYDKESDSLKSIQDTYKGEANAEFVNKDAFIKHDQKKPMYHLVDPYAYEDLAKCLTFGSKKYDADNWKKGDIKTYISALERHLAEIKKALEIEDYSLLTDKDSSLQHGAALMCNSMFIHYFADKMLKEEQYEK